MKKAGMDPKVSRILINIAGSGEKCISRVDIDK